jgi:hypothetical protein
MLSAIDTDRLTGLEISVRRCQEENASNRSRAGFVAVDGASVDLSLAHLLRDSCHNFVA